MKIKNKITKLQTCEIAFVFFPISATAERISIKPHT